MWKPPTVSVMTSIVFDANPFSRRIATDCLRRMGIDRIVHPANTKELTTLLSYSDAELLVLDWGLNKIIRDELFMILHHWGDTRSENQFFVFTSANAQESNLRMAALVGANAIIIKPFSQRSFCERVGFVLNRPRAAPKPITIPDISRTEPAA